MFVEAVVWLSSVRTSSSLGQVDHGHDEPHRSDQDAKHHHKDRTDVSTGEKSFLSQPHDAGGGDDVGEGSRGEHTLVIEVKRMWIGLFLFRYF